jgi:hypothetical protein
MWDPQHLTTLCCCGDSLYFSHSKEGLGTSAWAAFTDWSSLGVSNGYIIKALRDVHAVQTGSRVSHGDGGPQSIPLNCNEH